MTGFDIQPQSLQTAGQGVVSVADQLAELITWHQIDKQTVGTVLSIDSTVLGPSEREALDDLRSYYNGTW